MITVVNLLQILKDLDTYLRAIWLECCGHLCMQCMYEDEVWGTLCSKHAKEHPHDDYDEPIPLVNSPRLGMCGYDGPAKPPY